MAANNDSLYFLFDVCNISQGIMYSSDPPVQLQLKILKKSYSIWRPLSHLNQFFPLSS